MCGMLRRKETIDRYGGVTIDLGDYPSSQCDGFHSALKEALSSWQTDDVRAVWIKVPLDKSTLIAACVQEGFKYHHAKPEYAMMIRWLPDKEKSSVPDYAHHYIGVGSIVVNEKDEILTIQEQYLFDGIPRWKLPGGLVDPGEDLAEAARREVREETGVEAEFESMLLCRQHHHAPFGCSDFYFVCVLRPSSAQLLQPCSREIRAYRWMNIHEYANDPSLTEGNRWFVNQFLRMRDNDVKIRPVALPFVIAGKTAVTYALTDKTNPLEQAPSSS